MVPVQSRSRGTFGRGMPARRLFCLLATSAVVAAWPTGAVAAPTPQPAVSADAGLEAIGLNTKFTDNTPSNCALVPVLRDAMRDLRIRHIRDGMGSWDKAMTRCRWLERGRVHEASALDLLVGFAPQVRSLLLIGALNRTTWLQGVPTDQLLRRVSRPGPDNDVLDAAEILARAGGLAGLEGPNEFDLAGFRTFSIGDYQVHPWLSAIRTYQAGLYTTVKTANRSLLQSVPLVGPSFGRFRSYEGYAGQGFDGSGLQDIGNLHYYNDTRIPEQRTQGPRNDLADAVESVQSVAPGQPFWTTEFGYHTAPESRDVMGVYNGVSERAAATYIPRFILELQNLGSARSYLFSLRDHRNTGPEDPEAHWGLMRWDGSRRPAFATVARLAAALNDPGPAYEPAPLTYELTGDDQDDVRTRLFGRRDGSYVLAIWRAVSVWDGPNRTPIAIDPKRVGLVLDKPDRFDAATANLAEGTAAGDLRWRAARRATGPIDLDLTGDVQLVRISPR